MIAKQTSKSKLAGGIIAATSIPIILIFIGIIIAIGWASRTDPVTGITNTTVENIAFYGSLYITLPCGLISVITGIYALVKGALKKSFAIIGIAIGIIGILVGGLALTAYIVVASFRF